MAVLSFSTPPHLIDLNLRSPLSENVIPQEEASVTGVRTPDNATKP
jgi:hypothetical protein